MAVSRKPRHNRRLEQLLRTFRGLSRHDLVLGLIPLVLAVPFALYALLAVPFYHAVGIGSTVAAVMVTDALFVHPPAEQSTENA
jgi:hypothetical protein